MPFFLASPSLSPSFAQAEKQATKTLDILFSYAGMYPIMR